MGDSSGSSNKVDALDGKWIEKKQPDKIYTVKKGIVTEGTRKGEIIPLKNNKLSLKIEEEELVEGTHSVPDDEIKWDDDVVWRRFQDGDGGATEDGKGKDQEIAKLKQQIEKMNNEKRNEGDKKLALNGMWINKKKDTEPLENQDIYLIEDGKVTDGEEKVPITISDTDKGLIIETEKQFKNNYDIGEHKGTIPEDEINWGPNDTWIRLKLTKIQELQKKINENDGGSQDLKDEIRSLQEKLNDEKDNGKKKIDEMGTQIKDLTTKQREMIEDKIDEEKNNFPDKSKELDDLNDLKQEVEKMKKTNEDELKLRDDKNNKLDNQITDLMTKLSDKDDKIGQLKKGLEDKGSEINVRDLKIKEKDSEISDLRNRLEELNKKEDDPTLMGKNTIKETTEIIGGKGPTQIIENLSDDPTLIGKNTMKDLSQTFLT